MRSWEAYKREINIISKYTCGDYVSPKLNSDDKE